MKAIPTPIQVITAVLHIEAAEPLGQGISIGDNLYISNDPAIPRRILDPRVTSTIGRLEAEQLLRAPLFIYGDWTEEAGAASYEHIVLLNKKIQAIYSFFLALWMLRDNGADTELSFLIERFSDTQPRVSSNLMSHTNSRHDLKKTCETFSKEEILSAYNKFGKVFRNAEKGIPVPELELKMSKEQGRIGRAFQFLVAARASNSTFLKVANYCSCLESLFCVDTQEISHKLAERVAVFLEKSPARRLELFRQTKEAYGLRSKVIHGSAIKKLAPDLVRICATLDCIVRRVLTRIILEDETYDLFKLERQDLLEERFLQMLF